MRVRPRPPPPPPPQVNLPCQSSPDMLACLSSSHQSKGINHDLTQDTSAALLLFGDRRLGATSCLSFFSSSLPFFFSPLFSVPMVGLARVLSVRGGGPSERGGLSHARIIVLHQGSPLTSQLGEQWRAAGRQTSAAGRTTHRRGHTHTHTHTHTSPPSGS